MTWIARSYHFFDLYLLAFASIFGLSFQFATSLQWWKFRRDYAFPWVALMSFEFGWWSGALPQKWHWAWPWNPVSLAKSWFDLGSFSTAYSLWTDRWSSDPIIPSICPGFPTLTWYQCCASWSIRLTSEFSKSSYPCPFHFSPAFILFFAAFLSFRSLVFRSVTSFLWSLPPSIHIWSSTYSMYPLHLPVCRPADQCAVSFVATPECAVGAPAHTASTNLHISREPMTLTLSLKCPPFYLGSSW